MQVIGHRGAAALAPENTWESFDQAIALGVDAIETDIQATAEGKLILIHDYQLDRTTNGQGWVKETPWTVIQTLDAGSWFAPTYKNAKIPRLDKTLERYGEQTHLVLEIKQSGIETQVLQTVQTFNLLDRVTFTAFDFAAVQNIKAQTPSAHVGWLTSRLEAADIPKIIAANINQICLPAHSLTLEKVADLKALGLEVRAWKVTDEAAMITAMNAQVDGMTVDFPHLLLAALGRSKSSSDRLK
jgi:glycerophosphoryl diester phosphodiesterase